MQDLTEKIKQQLYEVIDPELGINIVDLGLVYGITCKNGAAQITMTLTTPVCPLDGYFREAIERTLQELSDVANVEIFFTFDPPWNKSKISPEGKLALGIV